MSTPFRTAFCWTGSLDSFTVLFCQSALISSHSTAYQFYGLVSHKSEHRSIYALTICLTLASKGKPLFHCVAQPFPCLCLTDDLPPSVFIFVRAVKWPCSAGWGWECCQTCLWFFSVVSPTLKILATEKKKKRNQKNTCLHLRSRYLRLCGGVDITFLRGFANLKRGKALNW